jgi:hypothetical protein
LGSSEQFGEEEEEPRGRLLTEEKENIVQREGEGRYQEMMFRVHYRGGLLLSQMTSVPAVTSEEESSPFIRLLNHMKLFHLPSFSKVPVYSLKKLPRGQLSGRYSVPTTSSHSVEQLADERSGSVMV